MYVFSELLELAMITFTDIPTKLEFAKLCTASFQLENYTVFTGGHDSA